MSNTLRLGLPEISSSQASKEITHNEALEILDALTQPGASEAADPPGSPVAGSLYLITSPATGAWTGYEGYIAQARGDGSWNLIAPKHNFWVIVDSEPLKIMVYNAYSSPPDWATISTSGAFAFTDLTDVPANYTDAADKQVYVNHAGNGLEFRVPAGVEEAQDAIGAALTNTVTIHATYLDSYNQMIWDVQDNTSTQKIKIAKAASLIGTRQEINLIEGSNVSLTVSDNAGSDRVDVTIAATGSSTVANLDDLADVVITTPSETQVLTYDGENWVNAAAPAGYTDEQAQDAIGAALTDTATVHPTYLDAYDQMIWDVQDNTNTQKVIIAKAASDVGTRHKVNLIEGSNVTLTVTDDSPNDRVNVTIAAAGYTDEQAQDAVGGILTDSASIDFTYNDTDNTITAAVISQPYVVGVTFPGVPANNQLMILHKFPVAVTFPTSLTGSQGVAVTAATAQTDFDVQKNGSSVGTVRWAASGTSASFISASGASYAAGDVMKVLGPATADATLADIGISLLGTR